VRHQLRAQAGARGLGVLVIKSSGSLQVGATPGGGNALERRRDLSQL
jgi:hypothetical protein